MMKRWISRILVVAMVISIVSCSSPAPRKEFDRNFRTIALVSPKDIVDVVQADTRGQRAQEGAGVGLTGGALGGAAIGALACGPFLYGLCVTALMSGGLLAGGVAGALYGLSGFPKETAEKLQENLEALSREKDIPSALVEHIREQVDPKMLAGPESAEIQAVLHIENIEFMKEGGDVQLRTTVRASFESTESQRVPLYGSRNFTGRSGLYDVDDWLDASSGKLEEAMRESLLAASVKIVQVLNERWQPEGTAK